MYCSGVELDQCTVVSGIGPGYCSGVGLDQCTVVEWDWTRVL